MGHVTFENLHSVQNLHKILHKSKILWRILWRKNFVHKGILWRLRASFSDNRHSVICKRAIVTLSIRFLFRHTCTPITRTCSQGFLKVRQSLFAYQLIDWLLRWTIGQMKHSSHKNLNKPKLFVICEKVGKSKIVTLIRKFNLLGAKFWLEVYYHTTSY